VQKGFNTSVNNSAGAVISQGQVVTQASYDANYPTDYIVTFTDAVTYDITTEAGAVVLTGQPYTSGAAINFNGIEFAISGVPAGGDTFAIDSTGKQSIMTTIGLLVEGLNTLTDSPTDLATLAQLIDDSLANITAAENNLAQIWATVGARQNTVDNVRNLQEGIDVVSQKVISELRDLDYAEAISRLSMETFTLEAAQQSFSRVNSLSLFNFI
jgi:flagellar hook-associated protein 3 FlgL